MVIVPMPLITVDLMVMGDAEIIMEAVIGLAVVPDGTQMVPQAITPVITVQMSMGDMDLQEVVLGPSKAD